MTPSSHSSILPFPSRAAMPFELVRVSRSSTLLARLNSLTPEERADHIASIIRPAIMFAKRKGRRLEHLPPQLRTWLRDLCDLGDPTCLMVMGWLSGNAALPTDQIKGDV